jgi:hypothetical protein
MVFVSDYQGAIPSLLLRFICLRSFTGGNTLLTDPQIMSSP